MNTLTERNVRHRLVVVSCDGNKNMEAIVAALLNICVDSDASQSNAINRTVCGERYTANIPKKVDEHTRALLKHNREFEMIICVHCKKEICIESDAPILLNMHACRASGLKGNNGKPSLVYARLYTRTYWCPSKETCKACVVIVPRPEDDIIKDFPLDDI
jgi:hypothetical protein